MTKLRCTQVYPPWVKNGKPVYIIDMAYGATPEDAFIIHMKQLDDLRRYMDSIS